MSGKTNLGKTEYAEAHFERPTIVRTRDDLKRATFFTDGIIFDDFDFGKWTPEEIIHLLSYETNRSLPARYSDAHIEAFVPLIFTTNKHPKNLFPRSTCKEQRKAIRRRHARVNKGHGGPAAARAAVDCCRAAGTSLGGSERATGARCGHGGARSLWVDVRLRAAEVGLIGP